MGNSFGYLFRLTTFGESHGVAVGGIIDGCPSGLLIDPGYIQGEIGRRRPLYSGSTGRKEPDLVEFLSGVHKGKSTGAPIAFLVKNTSVNASDYSEIEHAYRPSHADYTYERKYRAPIDPGGGRASGRETVARVVAGSVAKLFLQSSGIAVNACVSQIGGVIIDVNPINADYSFALRSPFACPDADSETRIGSLVSEAASSGNTLGGTVTCRIKGTPPGLGEPVFDKLQASLAKAMLSIGSAKAFEYGLGFNAAFLSGSEYNDAMTVKQGKISFLTNHDGGIQGGISNGEDIYFRVGFKPVPSVKLPQSTVNSRGEAAEILISGRHDSCHIPRLVVIVESMAALVLADHLLMDKASRL
jgi:chorismate synthase